ncbi:hypothetical protein N7931_13015 [Catenovulum sp. 2E275]|uniref:TIM-barrel domain-containing protein n=1 Tax=Catenovulum sp. 2E275 TaxID=2980497 RepID=UPI0021D2F8C1|nr:TIM-barrel domain-containing protein [Catenovulum sp. 2E275]MCU4676551.1 hypothetical protein [Catenovulum sp. 2E275]
MIKKIHVFIIALSWLALPSLAAQLTYQNSQLNFDNGKLQILKDGKTIIDLQDILLNYQSAKTWQLTSATQDKLTLVASFSDQVEMYKSIYDTADRQVEFEISLVKGGYRIYAQPKWLAHVTLKFNALGDHFFGLSEPLQPDNQLSPDLKGAVIDVEINGNNNNLHENYASAYSAFYISSYGYGAFFDSFAKGRYYFDINGENKIHHDANKLDWYIFLGDSGEQIHQAYFDLIGEPKKVPVWAMGAIGWRNNNANAAEIISDIKILTALKMPFTGWFVDRPYSDGAHAWSKMNFNQNFADPKQWIAQINNEFGMKFMTWASTPFFEDPRFDKHLTSSYNYLDLTDNPSLAAFKQELTNKQYKVGVQGHKIDRLDEMFSEHEVWTDASVTVDERKNKYAVLTAKAFNDALQDYWGDEHFNFARSAYHRSQPYLSAIWGGDPRSSWQGLQANFANAMRASFMGFPVWGTDVSGYLGEAIIDKDLYIRWMQAGSMTGFFEIKVDGQSSKHGDRLPNKYDENFQQIYRQILEDRMRFVPYLYSLAHTSAQNGPLMQPLTYRHLTDQNTYSIWDQFYLGKALLVAPVFEKAYQRQVYLPQGHWADFDNPAKLYQGGKTIKISAPLNKLPRFIGQNQLLVTGNIIQGNAKNWQLFEPELTIHAYPAMQKAQTQFEYIDYLDANQAKTIRMMSSPKQIEITAPAFNHKLNMSLIIEDQPKAVLQAGQTIPYQFDASKNLLTLNLSKGQPAKLTLIK